MLSNSFLDLLPLLNSCEKKAAEPHATNALPQVVASAYNGQSPAPSQSLKKPALAMLLLLPAPLPFLSLE